MAELTDAPAPLDAKETAQLTEFARACKAAARAVVLYPAGHPAIAATLGRIADITTPPALAGAAQDPRAARRPAARRARAGAPRRARRARGAAAQPSHRRADRPPGRRRRRVAHLPAAPRADAGVGAQRRRHRARVDDDGRPPRGAARESTTPRCCASAPGGDPAVWNRVIANCLQGSAFELDESGIRELLGIAVDSEQLASLMASLESKVESGGGIGAKTAALMRMLRGIVDVVSKNEPERLEPVLQNMATAVGQCSPEMLLGLLGQQGDEEGPRLMQAVVSRMTDTDDRALRVAPRDRGGHADRSAGAGVPDAGARRRPAAAPAGARARRRRGVAARQHGRVRVGLEPRRGEAADVLLRRAVRLGGLRPRAVGRAHAGGRGRTRQRRSAGAHQRVARHDRHDGAARARPDAGARSAADRRGRGALGRADEAGRRRCSRICCWSATSTPPPSWSTCW